MEENSGRVLWFTGLSGAGKSTLCVTLALELNRRGYRAHVLDGDDVRKGLCSDLGFSVQDRFENVRRVMHVVDLMAQTGTIVLVAVISPYQVLRDMARAHIPDMLEIFVDAPLAVCEQRDPKGLYRQARAGELKNFTGIDSPFETPLAPDLICRTDRESVEECVSKILKQMLGEESMAGRQLVQRRPVVSVN